jgi:hypothetical protein
MKKLTRGRVVPIISASVSWLVLAAAILGVRIDDLFVEAGRLPTDMRGDLKQVVQAYRRLRQQARRCIFRGSPENVSSAAIIPFPYRSGRWS